MKHRVILSQFELEAALMEFYEDHYPDGIDNVTFAVEVMPIGRAEWAAVAGVRVVLEGSTHTRGDDLEEMRTKAKAAKAAKQVPSLETFSGSDT